MYGMCVYYWLQLRSSVHQAAGFIRMIFRESKINDAAHLALLRGFSGFFSGFCWNKIHVPNHQPDIIEK